MKKTTGRISDVRTERFEWSHGRKPRTQHGQRASWYFEVAGQQVQFYGTFTEAKQLLKDWARTNLQGTHQAQVLP